MSSAVALRVLLKNRCTFLRRPFQTDNNKKSPNTAYLGQREQRRLVFGISQILFLKAGYKYLVGAAS